MRTLKIVASFVLVIVFVSGLLAPALAMPAHAQDGCGSAPPPRLTVGSAGIVSFTDGRPLNVRASASLAGALVGQLPEGSAFQVIDGPACADNIYWWQIQADALTGWIAEGVDTEYFVEPFLTPPAPQGTPAPLAAGQPFTTWNWAALSSGYWGDPPLDPMTIIPPATYAGDLPPLPVDLTNVLFLDDAALNEAQRALLAQNGFVVVPAGFDQFDEAYRDTDEWPMVPATYTMDLDPSQQDLGHAHFVTTDATLHALHYIFDNLLTDLEKLAFYDMLTQQIVTPALNAAHQQTQQAAGTALEGPARAAELYLAVALELLQPGQLATVTDAAIAADAANLAALAVAAEGRIELSFLPGYTEDFSQYRPRGHYDGDEMLERYFRGMMWLSRITFRASEDGETQIALMLLRALRSAPEAIDGWQTLHDMLTFLIGPIDDLSMLDYSPLADSVFGADLPLAHLADPALLAQFKAQVEQLPAPRVNGLVLPDDTTADEVAEKTRGFRFMGQRFTFDAYAMQQVMYPYVGTRETPRLLPLGLDVASVMGSDVAYTLAAEAGATEYLNYDIQTGTIRSEISALTQDHWLENTYGGWLWTLQPLWHRNPQSYPPMMNTTAWLRKDLQAGLASWTELKHDTVLYVKQPTGFGGGGIPLMSYGYVEPNPLVFARIAIVAGMTFQGLTERGIGVQPLQLGYNVPRAPGHLLPALQGDSSLIASLVELRDIAFESAMLAEIARKELAGQPLSEDDYWVIFHFGDYLNELLRTLYQGEGEPDPVALVTDVASNPSINSVLQEAVGGVDLIYVVVPNTRGGWQLARGGVFSYYEWIGNIDQRMTDEAWRTQVAAGNLPPRPPWISAFYAE